MPPAANTLKTISACLAALVVFTASAIDAVADSSRHWWEKHDEGWFFYNERIAPEQQEEPAAPPPPAAKPDTKEAPLATELIKKEGDRLLSEAMVNPTEENVVRYMRYQKESLDMSTRLAHIWQRMLMKYPDLYMNTGTTQVDHDMKEAVDRLGRKAGLFFIYSSGCSACQHAVTVVADFKNAHPGFHVMPITIDTALPGLENSRPDNGIAASLGVTSVPAWYLAYPDEDRFEHIGTGSITLSDLERRLYHYDLTQDMRHYSSSRSSGNAGDSEP